MADRFVIATLQRLPILKDASQKDIEILAEHVQIRQYQPRDVLFKTGDVSQGLYYFVSGSGSLLQQQPDQTWHQIGQVARNQFINDVALEMPTRETATLYINQPSVVLFLSRDVYQKFLNKQLPEQQANKPKPISPPPRLQHSQLSTPPPPPTSSPQASPKTSPQAPLIQPDRQTPTQMDGAYTTPVENTAQQNGGQQNEQETHEPSEQIIDNEIDHPLVAVVSEQEKKFPGQREGEEVVHMTQRHRWVLFRAIWLPFLVFVIMVSVATFIELSTFLRILIYGVAFVLPGLLMFYWYLEWRNDWLIITNERVVHIERILITATTRISDIPLISVQAVNSELGRTIPARIMRFGDLEIKTAGGSGNIILDAIPLPLTIKDYVFKQRTKIQQKEEQRQKQELIEGELQRKLNEANQQPDETNNEPSIPPRTDTDPFSDTPAKNPWLLATRYVNENGDIVYRRHWIVWFGYVFWPGLMISICIITILTWLSVDMLNALGPIIPVGGFIGILIGLIWFYYADWDWRHDTFIITHKVINSIHRRPLWLQYVDDQILLERVDNTVANTGGILRSLLSYGDVTVTLTGNEESRVFDRVPKPTTMRAEISQRQQEARQRAKEAAEKANLAATIESIEAYHRMYGKPPPPPPTVDTSNTST